MAELHVQTKKTGSSWIWIVFLLIVLVIVGYVVMTRNNATNQKTDTSQKDTLSFFQPGIHQPVVYIKKQFPN
jgi:bacteriorhodopsin